MIISISEKQILEKWPFFENPDGDPRRLGWGEGPASPQDPHMAPKVARVLVKFL